MKIYTSVSLELITPKVGRLVDLYVDKWHKQKLKQADYSSLVGELVGYNVIDTDKSGIAGYCDYRGKEIALKMSQNRGYLTIFHEIGHAIQAEIEQFEVRQNLISEDLYDEWQAETIAWQMYNRCFPDNPKDKSKFNTYMCKDDWMFLIDYYGDWRQNDIEQHLNNPLYQ